MQLGLEKHLGQLAIHHYEIGKIVLNDGQIIQQSFFIFREQLETAWSPPAPSQLRVEHFREILALKPEIVILGTGKRLIFPPAAVMQPFAEHRIGLEVMDTGAACRTYNLVLSEGRSVCAALFPIEP